MSSTLFWEPIIDSAKYLGGCDLKFFLRKIYEKESVNKIFTLGDIRELKAARYSAQGYLEKDLDNLIELIKKHKEIRVWGGYE